jgi:hypothetical protein
MSWTSRQTHSDNEFKPGCEKRFATFYGCFSKSSLRKRGLYFRFFATLGYILVQKVEIEIYLS